MSGPLRGEAIRALLRPLVAALAAFLLLLSCSAAVLPEGEVPYHRVLEARMFDLVNGYRSSAGLEALEWDESLAEIARAHARSMADGTRTLSHRCFAYRSRLAAGLVGGGVLRENAGCVSESATPWSEILTGWRFSGSHRSTMLCESTITGIGAASSAEGTVYVVQLFYMRSRPDRGISHPALAIQDESI